MSKAKRTNLEIVRDVAFKNDKRTFSRFSVGDVSMRFKDLKTGEKGSAVCHDISGGGAGIESFQEIRPRTPLELWLDLPDGFEPLHLLGKVAWSKALGASCLLGIEFERARLMSMSRILKLTQ